MRPTQKAEFNSKIASRRFSKGITCQIIEGAPVIAFLRQNNLIPLGLSGGLNLDIAYSMTHDRAFVLPLHVVEEFQNLVKIAGLSLSLASDQEGKSNTTAAPADEKQSVTDQIKISKRREPLITFLKQTMLMVRINPNDIPKNCRATLKNCFVVVDSIDTSQATFGTLVPKPVMFENHTKQFNDK